jgi:hypothetical protein
MDMEARPGRDPAFYLRVLVGRVIIDNDVDIERGRDLSVNVS